MPHKTNKSPIHDGMTDDAVVMYSSMVVHRRLFPVSYRFNYRIFNILIDVDRLAEAHQHSPLLSINRRNLFSFYCTDHLPNTHQASSLRAWAENELRQFSIDAFPHHIYLLSFPRVFGYVFSPISIWYCMDKNNQPIAIICEVNNTFGEKHYYLLHKQNNTMQWPVRQRRAKHFHVSPFIGMDADYEFRISEPNKLATVGIREYKDDKLMLVAALKGQRIPLSTRNLVIQSIRVPLQTFKVILTIHWRAFWIWLAGAPLYFKPAPPKEEIS
jgi:DUF1365 family protein